MSAFSEAAPQRMNRQGPPCSVQVALDLMDEESRADCDAAMRAPLHEWNHGRVADAINGMGLSVQLNADRIGNHRRGECRCRVRLLP